MEVLEYVVKYLPAGFVTIIVTTFAVLAILGKLKNLVSGFINIFKHKKKEQKVITHNDLDILINEVRNHQFFNYLDYAVRYRIPKMKFDCDARTALLQKFLTIKCQVFYNRTKNLIDLDVNNMNHKCLEKIILTDIIEGIKEYELKMKAEAITMEEKVVIDVVIDRFSAWHDKNVEAAYKVIENIFDSDGVYQNNYDRMYGVLNVYLFAFVSAFTDAEKALYHINGEISGKMYQGKIIK